MMMKKTAAWLIAGLLPLSLLSAQGEEYKAWELKPADGSQGVRVTLTNGASQAEGAGVSIQGDRVTITQGGVYALSGALSQGQIVVDSQDDERVYLVLEGVTVASQDEPALCVRNARKVVITLAEGSENALTDQGTVGKEEGACLYAKDDVIINGTGSLTIHAQRKDGINCRDELKLISGTLSVTAVEDGILGKDCVVLRNALVTINTQKDGIKATNAEDAARGYIILEGGQLTITAGNDGIQAETALTMTGGQVTVLSGGGSAQAVQAMGSRTWASPGRGWEDNTDWDDGQTESTKGLKAGTSLTLSGGTLTVDSLDDSLHANGDVNLSGGVLSLASGDDGIHGDGLVTVSGGEITVSTSYEGLEGAQIVISGGTLSLTSTDDGINATGTTSSQGMGGGWGKGDAKLTLTGGEIWVDAQGDGIDVNGEAMMSGGTVYVSGPTNSGNGALDYDSSFTVTGGTLIAAGSSGMAQSPSQGTGFTIYGSESTGAVRVTDAQGQELLSFQPAKSYSAVVICFQTLTAGATYTVTACGTTQTLQAEALTASEMGGWGGGFGNHPGGGRGR